MNDEKVHGRIIFYNMIGDKYTVEEQEKIFKTALNKKSELTYTECFKNNEFVVTTILPTDTQNEYLILRYDDYGDVWYQEMIPILEKIYLWL